MRAGRSSTKQRRTENEEQQTEQEKEEERQWQKRKEEFDRALREKRARDQAAAEERAAQARAAAAAERRRWKAIEGDWACQKAHLMGFWVAFYTARRGVNRKGDCVLSVCDCALLDAFASR